MLPTALVTTNVFAPTILITRTCSGWWFSRGLGRQKSQPRRDLLASSLSREDGLRRHEAVPVSEYQQCWFTLVSVIGCWFLKQWFEVHLSCCANDDDFDKVIWVLLEHCVFLVRRRILLHLVKLIFFFKYWVLSNNWTDLSGMLTKFFRNA